MECRLDWKRALIYFERPDAARNEYDRHNYSISFQAPEQCGFLDCALCSRDVTVINPLVLVTLGKSLFDPEVQAATARYQQRMASRLKQLHLMLLAILTIALTNATFEALDAGDDGDEEIRAAALKELENEVEGEE